MNGLYQVLQQHCVLNTELHKAAPDGGEGKVMGCRSCGAPLNVIVNGKAALVASFEPHIEIDDDDPDMIAIGTKLAGPPLVFNRTFTPSCGLCGAENPIHIRRK